MNDEQNNSANTSGGDNQINPAGTTPMPVADDKQEVQEKAVSTETPTEEKKDPTGGAIKTDNSLASEIASLEQKRKDAVIAMEGEEGKLKREQREKEEEEHAIKEKLREEKKGIEKKLAEIAKIKTEKELLWIRVSDQKKPLEIELAPIKKQEAEIESKEMIIEQDEKIALSPAEKHQIESKRWQAEDERRQLEKAKWQIEEKIVAFDQTLSGLTAEYQKLLDEEDGLISRKNEIEKNLEVYGG